MGSNELPQVEVVTFLSNVRAAYCDGVILVAQAPTPEETERRKQAAVAAYLASR